MDDYMIDAMVQHKLWKRKMRKNISFTNKFTSAAQKKINSILPDKYHEVLTNAVKTMVKSVLLGYQYITLEPYEEITIEDEKIW